MPLYQIEAILDGPDDQDRFFIKWEGYSDAENTWEPRANLPDGMLDEYLGAVEETKEEESDTSSSSTVENLSRRRRAGNGLMSMVGCDFMRNGLMSMLRGGWLWDESLDLLVTSITRWLARKVTFCFGWK
jgi:hypothetical protein